jgi:hypothetical protein
MTSPTAATSQAAAEDRAVEKASASKIVLPTLNLDDIKNFEVELEGQLMPYQLDFLMQRRTHNRTTQLFRRCFVLDFAQH